MLSHGDTGLAAGSLPSVKADLDQLTCEFISPLTFYCTILPRCSILEPNLRWLSAVAQPSIHSRLSPYSSVSLLLLKEGAQVLSVFHSARSRDCLRELPPLLFQSKCFYFSFFLLEACYSWEFARCIIFWPCIFCSGPSTWVFSRFLFFCS